MPIDVAFVIGCSEYDDEEISNLQYPGHDATSISNLLQSVCGVPVGNIITLASTSSHRFRPTRSNIIRELAEAQHREGDIPEIDRLFLFFSGHGMQSDAGRDYLLPSDAVLAALEDSALELDRLKHFIRSWHARASILLLDACRASTSGTKSSAALPPIAPDSLRVPGFATVWSCGPSERSYESEVCERGLFTYAIERAFTTGRCATVHQLDSFLRSELPKFCKQFERPRQSPFASVDPLEIKDTIIISQSKFNEWQTGLPIGNEVRLRVPVSTKPLLCPPGGLVCAVDFGTSFSLVSVFDLDGVHFVPDSDGRALIPSVVTFLPSRDFLIGRGALAHAHDRGNCCVTAIKRKLGSTEVVTVDGLAMRPEVVSSLILRSLMRNVEEFTGRNVANVIVSAPANFSLRQCNSLSRAFELAGIPIAKMVSEPSVASIVLARYMESPSHTIEFEGRSNSWTTALVLDLGGGTLDVSVVELSLGLHEIVALSGDRGLGGIDYDRVIYDYALQEIKSQYPQATLLPNELSQLLGEAELAKIRLGSSELTSVVLRRVEVSTGVLRDLDIPITRVKFRELAAALDQRVRECISTALKDLSESWYSEDHPIDVILLAGQGSKVFTVSDLIQEIFPGTPIESAFQENAVASGAGRYTGVLSGIEKEVLLMDAFPSSLGLKCSEVKSRKDAPDCIVSGDSLNNTSTIVLLRRNTVIPTRKAIYVRLDADAGASVRLSFVEHRSGSGEEPLGSLDIGIGDGDRKLILTVDVDSGRTVFFHLQNDSTKESQVIQVTNLFSRRLIQAEVERVRDRYAEQYRALPHMKLE